MTTSHSKVAPPHYAYKISPLEAIQEWGLGFCLGNVVKYIARCGKKEGETRLDDLEKAMFYLAKEIEYEKANPATTPKPEEWEVYHTQYGRYRIPLSLKHQFEYDLECKDAKLFLIGWQAWELEEGDPVVDDPAPTANIAIEGATATITKDERTYKIPIRMYAKFYGDSYILGQQEFRVEWSDYQSYP